MEQMGASVTVIFYLIFLGLIFGAFWKMFEKAGRPGWEGIVPIYNVWIWLKIIGKPSWWMFMLFIPIVNIVFSWFVSSATAKSYGKDNGFAIGLFLLGFVFYPILGFGSAKYIGPDGVAEEDLIKQIGQN